MATTAAPPPNPFAPAQRGAQKARILFYGASKSGKTLSALLVTRGIVGDGRIAVVDTEGGRVTLETGREQLVTQAQPTGFDAYSLEKPFHPDLVHQAIATAHSNGYDALVIDGLSPFWEGEGGVQTIVDSATPKGGNKFTSGWSVATPIHQAMLGAINNSPIHIVCTCRAKAEYVIEQNERGKSVPRKVGLKPVQRDGIEYEFDIAGLLDADHVAAFEARGPFEGMRVERPGVELGQKIRTWLDGAASAPLASTPVGGVGNAQAASGAFGSPAQASTPPTPAAPPQAPPTPPSATGDPFASTATGASSETLITSEQEQRLVTLAGELVEIDPSAGDLTVRVNNIDQRAHEWYDDRGVKELSTQQAADLIERVEHVVLELREAKAGKAQ